MAEQYRTFLVHKGWKEPTNQEAKRRGGMVPDGIVCSRGFHADARSIQAVLEGQYHQLLYIEYLAGLDDEKPLPEKEGQADGKKLMADGTPEGFRDFLRTHGFMEENYKPLYKISQVNLTKEDIAKLKVRVKK